MLHVHLFGLQITHGVKQSTTCLCTTYHHTTNYCRYLPLLELLWLDDILLWEPYPSYHNGLFSPLLVLRDFATRGRSISVLSELYETSYLFYVTPSFLCNIICYLISMFVFSCVILSRATTYMCYKLAHTKILQNFRPTQVT